MGFSCAAVLVTQHPSSALETAQLSFAERVRAQEAIDRVYYSHQVGAKRTFEEAVPRAVAEGKVRTYLRQSLALERYWQTPITPHALRAEIERIERHTQMPGRLAELYEALNHDPLLIQECLARPVLVDRLARGFFWKDERIHAAEKQIAEALTAGLADGRVDANSEHPRRSVIHIVREERAGANLPAERPTRRAVSPEAFARWKERLAGDKENVSLVERQDAFVVHVGLAQSEDELAVATFTVEKKNWESWWSEVEPGLNESTVELRVEGVPKIAVARDRNRKLPTASSPSCVAVRWDNGSLGDAPDPRSSHSAIWTVLVDLASRARLDRLPHFRQW